MRNWYVALTLGVLIVVSFLLWGDWFTALFSSEGLSAYLRQYGRWAWSIGLLLLIADLFLPLPGTLIMSSLGYLYGPFVGGLLSAIGNVLSGLLAFGICQSFGEKGARKILGEKDFEKGHRLFNQQGGWIVAISRWLPIIPEVVSCMAGLNRMKPMLFFIALLCGSLPLGFAFAWLGHFGHTNPQTMVIASAVIPPILWFAAHKTMIHLSKDPS